MVGLIELNEVLKGFKELLIVSGALVFDQYKPNACGIHKIRFDCELMVRFSVCHKVGFAINTLVAVAGDGVGGGGLHGSIPFGRL